MQRIDRERARELPSIQLQILVLYSVQRLPNKIEAGFFKIFLSILRDREQHCY